MCQFLSPTTLFIGPVFSIMGDAPKVTLRPFEASDGAQIAAIYREYVLTDPSTFEEEPPSGEEMERRANAILGRGFPYVVAVDGANEVLGYAYASLYRTRSAYRFTVENSVYVSKGKKGLGLGRKLMTEVIERCRALGVRIVLAVITVDPANGVDNTPSVGFHRAMGFSFSGLLENVGFKFDKWMHTAFMQLDLTQENQGEGQVAGEGGGGGGGR